MFLHFGFLEDVSLYLLQSSGEERHFACGISVEWRGVSGDVNCEIGDMRGDSEGLGE